MSRLSTLMSPVVSVIADDVLTICEEEINYRIRIYQEMKNRVARHNSKINPVYTIVTMFNEVNFVGLGDFIRVSHLGKWVMVRDLSVVKNQVEGFCYYCTRTKQLVWENVEYAEDVAYANFDNMFLGVEYD